MKNIKCIKCKKCSSLNCIKAGFVRSLQRYKCKDCGYYFTDTPLRGKPASMKALAVLLYTIGNQTYGMISRLLGVSNVSIYKWIKAEGIKIEKETLKEENNFNNFKSVQIDEMWHFVNGKKTKFGSGEPLTMCQVEFSPGLLVGVTIQRVRHF